MKTDTELSLREDEGKKKLTDHEGIPCQVIFRHGTYFFCGCYHSGCWRGPAVEEGVLSTWPKTPGVSETGVELKITWEK